LLLEPKVEEPTRLEIGVDRPEDKFSLENVAIGILLFDVPNVDVDVFFSGETAGRDAVERLELSRW
jgi:hypothetical protein